MPQVAQLTDAQKKKLDDLYRFGGCLSLVQEDIDKILGYRAHKWKLDEDGFIDMFTFEDEFCNGPACEYCGYVFCIHCNQYGWADAPCMPEDEDS